MVKVGELLDDVLVAVVKVAVNSREGASDVDAGSVNVAARVEAGLAGADEVVGGVEPDLAAVDRDGRVDELGVGRVLEVADPEGDLGDGGTGGLTRREVAGRGRERAGEEGRDDGKGLHCGVVGVLRSCL